MCAWVERGGGRTVVDHDAGHAQLTFHRVEDGLDGRGVAEVRLHCEVRWVGGRGARREGDLVAVARELGGDVRAYSRAGAEDEEDGGCCCHCLGRN